MGRQQTALSRRHPGVLPIETFYEILLMPRGVTLPSIMSARDVLCRACNQNAEIVLCHAR